LIDNNYYGVYRGVVTDTNDPKGKRRIRVQVPQISGQEVTDWAWAVNPVNATVTVNHPEGGAETAQVDKALPAVGSGVFVMFEGGDPNFPLWIGTF
jgi:hypothetical protein